MPARVTLLRLSSGGRDPRAADLGHLAGDDFRRDQVGLGQQHPGHRTALGHHGQIALQPLQVEVGEAGLHDDHAIDIGGDHLLDGGGAHRFAAQAGLPLQHRLHGADAATGIMRNTNPIADARPCRRGARAVHQVAGELRLEDPGLVQQHQPAAVHRGDARRGAVGAAMQLRLFGEPGVPAQGFTVGCFAVGIGLRHCSL